jgi:hypothetical protein
MLPDEAIDDATKFGFDDYSTLLTSVIQDQNLQTPFTIAIHGDWGSGKTSLMLTIAKKLEDTREGVRVKKIWFNAWEFEKIPTPLWTVFLNRVVIELQDMLPAGKARNKLKETGKGILLLTGDLLLQKTIGVTLNDIEKIKERVWTDIEAINSLKEKLSSYIDEALKNDPLHRKRVAIFIDDLDRCLPKRCIAIFESMKLFLNCSNCVFVVGIDKGQILKVFNSKFENKEEGNNDYFEKFVQLEFELPRKTPDEVKKFLMEYASQQLRENPKTIDLISRFIDPNPRKIKRWLNSVIFIERLSDIQQKKLGKRLRKLDLSIASIWLFLKSFSTEFTNLVESDPSMLNVAIRVARKEGTEDDEALLGTLKNDKRLFEFLSVLKPHYDVNEIKNLIYLTRMTSASNFSTAPEDILKRISHMTKSDFLEQLFMLGEEATISLTDRLINQLSVIPDWKSYDDYLSQFEFLELIVTNQENESTRSKLINRIVDFMLRSQYAYRYFLPKLESIIGENNEALATDPDFLGKIINIFAKSDTYNEAKLTSSLLLKFKTNLSSEQRNAIKLYSKQNNQIEGSWEANKNLDLLFA